jgi:acyl-CoA synthetase (AMP-forming)/AMP-acid ligase II
VNIADHVRRNASVIPAHAALTCDGMTWTWADLNNRVNQLASYFVEHLDRGDRVAIFGHNCHRYFEVYFACARAGMVCVPVNSRLLGPELAQILGDAEARLVVVDGRLEQEARRGVDGLEAGIAVVGFGSHGFATDYEALLPGRPLTEIDVHTRADEISVIAYTSGTTGRPKGATLTHLACVVSAYSYALNMLVTGEDRCLAAMPAYVYRGGSGGFAPVIVGAESVVAKFEASTVLDLIESRKVTHATFAPAMIQLLLAQPDIDQRDLSSLRQLWTGGAPIRSLTLERLHELVGEIVGAQYGMTEATGIAVIKYHSGDTDRLMSVGRPSSHVDVRIAAPDGADVALSQIGEIWVKGPAVTSGYWKAKEVDAQAFADGWFKTGDMARRDQDGYLYIVDRRIDIINSGGINVYTVEVENVISSHPGVAECVVIGVPDELYGEAVMAIVVPADGAPITEKDLQTWCHERLAGYKVPRQVRLIAELERNAMGKVNKPALRKTFWEGRERLVNG